MDQLNDEQIIGKNGWLDGWMDDIMFTMRDTNQGKSEIPAERKGWTKMDSKKQKVIGRPPREDHVCKAVAL